MIVSTAVLSGLPGALMIFSPRPLYPGHADGVVKWGLTLLEDQQLAGLIMWIPAGAAYVLAAALVFLRWLEEAEERAIRAARRGVSLIVMVSLAGLLLGGCDKEDNSSIVNFSGDAHRGASLINKYGCGGCHSIPDIANANGNVGPPLQHVGTRTYIAGIFNNSPDNMSLWLQNPQKVLPGNAMPAMGISQQDFSRYDRLSLHVEIAHMKRRGVITTARRAFRYGMARQVRDTHLFWGGEILFVAGWSLMWGSSLALIPSIPNPVCVTAMLVGLALPGYRQLRKTTSALARRAA